jgi:DNA-binding Lrp family transcriptional regulator
MDEADKKIIELLQQDGRMDDVEIARKIGISHDTVKRRRLSRMGWKVWALMGLTFTLMR